MVLVLMMIMTPDFVVDGSLDLNEDVLIMIYDVVGTGADDDNKLRPRDGGDEPFQHVDDDDVNDGGGGNDDDLFKER